MLRGKRLNLFYIITATLYILSIPLKLNTLDPLLKVFPLLVLFSAAYSQLSGNIRLLGLVAIVLCACGDVLLTQSIEQSFVYGLGAFVVGHIFYLIAFLQFANKRFIIAKLVMAIIVLCITIGLAMIILPVTENLLIPVSIYVGIITSMVVAAIFAWSKSMLHIGGAIIFMISDTILAWNMFLVPLPYASIGIMLTYYVAQFCIVAGLIKLFTDRQIHSSL